MILTTLIYSLLCFSLQACVFTVLQKGEVEHTILILSAMVTLIKQVKSQVEFSCVKLKSKITELNFK